MANYASANLNVFGAAVEKNRPADCIVCGSSKLSHSYTGPVLLVITQGFRETLQLYWVSGGQCGREKGAGCTAEL